MTVLSSLLSLALFLAICSPLVAQSGLKMRITRRGVNYANTIAQATIRDELRKTKLRDLPIIMKRVTGSITNIQTKKVVGPRSRLRLRPRQDGLLWSLTGLSIDLSANWRAEYKNGWFRISDHGSIDLGATGVSVSVTVAFGSSRDRPTIRLKRCSANIKDIDVQFHGGNAFIYNIFREFIGEKIRESLIPVICQEMERVITVNARDALARMKVTADIDRFFVIDYGLENSPDIQSQYIESLHKGEVFWRTDREPSPFSPPTFPGFNQTRKMVYLWLTEYSANTYAYAAHQNGHLQFVVTKADLLPGHENYFDTTCDEFCAGALIPELAERYPNSVLSFGVRSTASPSVKISPEDMTASAVGDVDVMVNRPDGSVVVLLKMNMTLFISVRLDIEDNLLVGSVATHGFSIDVKQSKMKDDSGLGDSLEELLGLTIQFSVIPELNRRGQRGADLPMSNDIKLLRAQFIPFDGYVIVGADVDYLPRIIPLPRNPKTAA